MKWIKSESTVKPEAIDMISSETSVYLRRNIKETTRTDEEGDETTWYEYEEAKLAHAQYEEYLQVAEAVNMRQTKADVDYIKLYLNIPQ